MASRESIITLPNPHLRKRSKRVGIITPEVATIIADMEAAALDWEDHRKHEVGVALAGVQIDQMLRLVIVRNDFDNKDDRTFVTLINPEITKYEGDIEEDFEGCLSITDVYGKVRRHNKIRLKALNLNGQEIRMTAEGFLARVLQHEVDHTNGIVFIDHIKDSKESFYQLQDDGKLGALDYDTVIKDNADLWL